MSNRWWVALGVALFGAAAISGVAHWPVYRSLEGHYYGTLDACFSRNDPPGTHYWIRMASNINPCRPVPLYQYLFPPPQETAMAETGSRAKPAR